MLDTSRASASVTDVRQFARHQHLVRGGEITDSIYRLDEGWACRYQSLSCGRRQITALYLPGEYCEPQWLLEARITTPIMALTRVRVRKFPLEEFGPTAPNSSENMRTMLSATLCTINRQFDWIATLGRKNAVERICALLGDIFSRMQQSGRAVDNRCTMPLTQADLADIVGLTPVHVNRVLGQLRARGLVELRSRQLRLPDPETILGIGAGNTLMGQVA